MQKKRANVEHCDNCGCEEHLPKRCDTCEDTRPICEAFGRIASMGIALKATPLSKHDGAWVHRWTDANGNEWAVAVNGQKHPAPDPLFGGDDIKPFNAVASFNGWPFGVLDPFGGTLGYGEAANENTFIAAIIAETERAAHPLEGAASK